VPALWPLLLLLLLLLLPLLPLLLLLLAPPPRPPFAVPSLLMLVECSCVGRRAVGCALSLSIDRDLSGCLVAVSRCVNARWNPETNETKMKLRC
jgi:hypothetical protein